MVADARYCLPIPSHYSDAEAAPLLCAGLIGFRAYRAPQQRQFGYVCFGAAAHLLAQIAAAENRQVFAFTRSGDLKAQPLPGSLAQPGLEDQMNGLRGSGCGDHLRACRLTCPGGAVATRKGGRVVCAGIHMSDIPSFPYELLWSERSVCSSPI